MQQSTPTSVGPSYCIRYAALRSPCPPSPAGLVGRGPSGKGNTVFLIMPTQDSVMFLGSAKTATCSKITSHAMLPVTPAVSHIVMWK